MSQHTCSWGLQHNTHWQQLCALLLHTVSHCFTRKILFCNHFWCVSHWLFLLKIDVTLKHPQHIPERRGRNVIKQDGKMMDCWDQEKRLCPTENLPVKAAVSGQHDDVGLLCIQRMCVINILNSASFSSELLVFIDQTDRLKKKKKITS